MSKIKSLILGSAAGFVAIAGAQAADLPVKAKAVQYVKICSLYGAGFYYIPGTETCIKIGGYVQFDVNLNSNTYDSPYIQGNNAFGSRDMDFFTTRQRTQFTVDTRTATEYGVVRSYWDVKFQFTSNTDTIAGGFIEVDYGFVQFAGFTFGKSVSAYNTPWNNSPANSNTSNLFGGSDNSTGVNNINYTWQFGNGVSAQIGLDEPKTTLAQGGYARGLLINVNAPTTAAQIATSAYTNAYGGNAAPDIVGNIRVDQAAFTAQLSAAAHNIHANYYGANETTGHPSDTWGFAVQGGLQLKNLPTGPGDKLTVDVAYANGANRYIIGGTFGNSYAVYNGGSDFPGSYQSVALGVNADGVYGQGGSIEKTDAYGVRVGFVHNWNQNWESGLFGSYSKVDFNGTATNLFCNTFIVTSGAKANGFSCNPDFAIWQVGSRLGWTPVRNLTFSAEVMYTAIDQSFTGSAGLAPGAFKPAASYDFKDLGTLSGNLRVRRTF
jgi:hypothetical protein